MSRLTTSWWQRAIARQMSSACSFPCLMKRPASSASGRRAWLLRIQRPRRPRQGARRALLLALINSSSLATRRSLTQPLRGPSFSWPLLPVRGSRRWRRCLSGSRRASPVCRACRRSAWTGFITRIRISIAIRLIVRTVSRCRFGASRELRRRLTSRGLRLHCMRRASRAIRCGGRRIAAWRMTWWRMAPSLARRS